MTTFTEKVEEIELNIKLAHNYKLGETLCLQLSQFPEVAEALIKAHQAEISRVLERVEKELAVMTPRQWRAINKIKGELQ